MTERTQLPSTSEYKQETCVLMYFDYCFFITELGYEAPTAAKKRARDVSYYANGTQKRLGESHGEYFDLLWVVTEFNLIYVCMDKRSVLRHLR